MKAAGSDRSRIRRNQRRTSYDRESVNAILDAGFFCHVAYEGPHGTVVIPTLYVRDGDSVISGDEQRWQEGLIERRPVG